MQSVPGENSDILIAGVKLHVQTEDWSDYRQSVVSRVYKNGSVVKTFKLSYQKITAVEMSENRKNAVLRLHQYAIESLIKNNS